MFRAKKSGHHRFQYFTKELPTATETLEETKIQFLLGGDSTQQKFPVLCKASAQETWTTRGETNIALEQHDQNPRSSLPS